LASVSGIESGIQKYQPELARIVGTDIAVIFLDSDISRFNLSFNIILETAVFHLPKQEPSGVHGFRVAPFQIVEQFFFVIGNFLPQRVGRS